MSALPSYSSTSWLWMMRNVWLVITSNILQPLVLLEFCEFCVKVSEVCMGLRIPI